MMVYICMPFFFRNQIEDSRLVAILFLKCVPIHFSDMQGPILFKLGTNTADDGTNMPLALFCDLIKDG